MANARGLGSFDLKDIEVVGEEPDKYYKKWGKPRTWYARAIREWKVSGDPSADARNWKPFTSFGDVADLAGAAGSAAEVYAATATVKADKRQMAAMAPTAPSILVRRFRLSVQAHKGFNKVLRRSTKDSRGSSEEHLNTPCIASNASFMARLKKYNSTRERDPCASSPLRSPSCS